MIFYIGSKTSLNDQLQIITNDLLYDFNIQKNNLNILLECLKKLNTMIQDAESLDNPKEIISLLKDVKNNLDNTRNNISNLENLRKHLNNLSSNLSEPLSEDAIANLNEYNELSTTYKNTICATYNSFKDFILKYIDNTEFIINETQSKSITSEAIGAPKVSKAPIESIESKAETNKVTNKQDNEDNNVLLISEIQKKIIIPYTIKELTQKLNDNKSYQNIQEIIDAEYTFPIEKYKSPIISRFKEAYNLMRKKEKSSITSSLNLAIELAFNSLLNPAIITACKNLNELDIYLDYLDSNELDKFDIFKVKYEILPAK